MANGKYGSFANMVVEGTVHWQRDEVLAVLLTGAVFDVTDVYLNDVSATHLGRVPVPGRSIAGDGSYLGFPVSFNRVPKDTLLQVVLIRNDGSDSLLTYYDVDAAAAPLSIRNNGTFILRPPPLDVADIGNIQGVWVRF